MNVSATQEARSFLRYTDAGEAQTVEIRATVKPTASDNDGWLYMRGQGEDAPDTVTCARVDDRLRHGEQRLTEYVDGVDAALASMDHIASADQQYELRAHMDGSTFRGKWWLPGELEPEECDLEDSTNVTEAG